MATRLGEHAVVIGGSMAGLMTARVLADHFDSVTVLERDRIDSGPAVHKSIPQGNHLHALLAGGQQALAALYPDLLARLEELGSLRAGAVFPVYFSGAKAYSMSGTVREKRNFGIDHHQQSRGLLEYCVRQCTLERANVKFESELAARGLVCRGKRIQGVVCGKSGDSRSLRADLVVDASGRGARTPQWLRELGFEAPTETLIGVDLAYSSVKFRVPDDHDRQEVFMIFFPYPGSPNGAITEIIEGDIWHITFAGRFGNYPPRDQAGLFAYAESLGIPKLRDLISDAKQVSDVISYRYPTATLRHYDQLSDFPDGFIVIGDAIASFNPIYGQGMSVAALQVGELRHLLAERATEKDGLIGLARRFFPKAADIASQAWTLAGDFDLAYPQTQGERPPDLKQRLAYFAAVDALTADDPEVHRLMVEVFQLCKPLSDLSEEPLRSRVVAEQRKHPEKYGA